MWVEIKNKAFAYNHKQCSFCSLDIFGKVWCTKISRFLLAILSRHIGLFGNQMGMPKPKLKLNVFRFPLFHFYIEYDSL